MDAVADGCDISINTVCN